MAEHPCRNDGVTITCPVCARAFTPAGRQRFCSPACRQTAWRRRHPTPLPTLPARLPQPATVYACAACGTRYLGQQRCEECQQFCRRIGPGGPCPHCEEPVAFVDLLPPEGGPSSASSLAPEYRSG
jgi:hypothetical protein